MTAPTAWNEIWYGIRGGVRGPRPTNVFRWCIWRGVEDAAPYKRIMFDFASVGDGVLDVPLLAFAWLYALL